MANRTRPIRIEFCVSDYEHRFIKSKMAQLGTHNMGAYLRKMAIDGYIIKVDYAFHRPIQIHRDKASLLCRGSASNHPNLHSTRTHRFPDPGCA